MLTQPASSPRKTTIPCGVWTPLGISPSRRGDLCGPYLVDRRSDGRETVKWRTPSRETQQIAFVATCVRLLVAQLAEDDWFRQLHNGPVDGTQLFGYPSDLIFRNAALSKNSQCNVQIRELLGIAWFVTLMGGNICCLHCRIAINPIAGQMGLPCWQPISAETPST